MLTMSESISSKEQVSTREWIRSRAPMGKWWPQWGQTLRFSSFSLSNTMFEHLGHLSQRPSGISRLRDLVLPSLGFLVKAVSAVVVGGGVTAGSDASNPRVFLLKVVAIRQQKSIIHRTTAIHHGRRSTRKLQPPRPPAAPWRTNWWW